MEKNPNINFSQVYKLAIFKEANREPVNDLNFKKLKLTDLRSQKAHLEADIGLLEVEIRELEEKYQEKEKELENKQLNELTVLAKQRMIRNGYNKWANENPDLAKVYYFDAWEKSEFNPYLNIQEVQK